MKTLQAEWIEYRDRCYEGHSLGKVQENETRQAFFAGLLVGLGRLSDIASMPEEEGIKALTAHFQETLLEVNKRIIELQPKG